MEECHSDVVSKVQRECVLSETVFLSFCDLTCFVSHLVESKPVDESFGCYHGRLGHLGDRERRTEADNRVHRERDHDGAVHQYGYMDVSRESGQ